MAAKVWADDRFFRLSPFHKAMLLLLHADVDDNNNVQVGDDGFELLHNRYFPNESHASCVVAFDDLALMGFVVQYKDDGHTYAHCTFPKMARVAKNVRCPMAPGQETRGMIIPETSYPPLESPLKEAALQFAVTLAKANKKGMITAGRLVNVDLQLRAWVAKYGAAAVLLGLEKSVANEKPYEGYVHAIARNHSNAKPKKAVRDMTLHEARHRDA